jgi:hypothetical protein
LVIDTSGLDARPGQRGAVDASALARCGDADTDFAPVIVGAVLPIIAGDVR